ncbi:MAG: glycyl-radical enzyme activating protein, partial [Acetivibrionales bacterium]
MKTQEKGIVFNIQRYSLHDGPGIRTIVFLKGCPLRCQWCSNPESQEIKPELSYIKKLCNKCNKCIDVCPQKAITATEDGIKIDRSKCDNCFKCVEVCAPGALKVEGQEMTVDEVVKEVMKDESFYKNSGGGLTLSGGEVLVQYAFAAEVLKAIKEKGISTAIETTGHASWEHFKQVLQYTDYVL